jgi:signal transduction histidine kinase/putative methionine-R-sulfoxide reductase with GAF domain
MATTKKKSPTDADELKRALQQKEKELYSIQRISRALSSTLKLDELLKLIMQEITILMDADRSTLYLLDKDRGEIWSKIALKAEVKEIRQKLGLGISGAVGKTGKIINIPDAYKDKRFDPSTDKRTGYRTRSILCMPVWEPLSRGDKPEILGVVQVLNKKEGFFTQDDERLLETIASQVAISIANSRLYHQLEKKYQEIDVLYEFEQFISTLFDFSEILKQILTKTINYLQADSVLAYFPTTNEHVFAGVEKSGTAIYQTASDVSNDWLEFTREPSVSRMKEMWPRFQIYFKIKKQYSDDGRPPIFSTISIDKEKNGLFLASGINASSSQEFQDQQKIFELIAQKISRALELEMLRQNLLKQERLSGIGQMMSTVVHDIKSPINTVKGFVELMEEDSSSNDDRHEFADIIRLEINSLMNMVTEILDFAKGKTSILPRKSSAKNVMKRFEISLKQMCQRMNTDLHLNVDSKQVIYVDEDKLSRVFHNITKNALEAMGDGGSFYVNVNDDLDNVIFQFRDTGPGIPEQIKSRLFDSFVTSGKESGTGLGLAIVKKIIDEHKGNIEIESKKGKGATFRIKLPVYKMN